MIYIGLGRFERRVAKKNFPVSPDFRVDSGLPADITLPRCRISRHKARPVRGRAGKDGEQWQEKIASRRSSAFRSSRQ